jgi:hypothetical protein
MPEMSIAIRSSLLALLMIVALGGRPSAYPDGHATATQPAEPAALTLDVTVVDGRGEPVAGLGADAFRVSIGDTPRSVTGVTFVDLRSPAARESESGSAPPSGRSLYLVIDESSVFAGAERPLIDVGKAVLDRLLPHDRVALVALPGPAPRVEVSSDVARVEAGLGQLAGKRPADLGNFRMGLGEALGLLENDKLLLTAVADRECRVAGPGLAIEGHNSRVSASAARADCIKKLMEDVHQMTRMARTGALAVQRDLLTLLTSLRDVAGPKAVVFVTAGLALEREPAVLDEVGVRAAAADASLHVLMVDAAQASRGARLFAADAVSNRRSLELRLRDLTARTRGTTQIVTARSDGSFDRLARELTAFYRLTVAVDPATIARSAPSAREVRIQVPGRDATVRVRPLFGSGASAPAPAATATPDERLAEALRGSAATLDGLPLQATGYTVVGRSGAPSLLIAGSLGEGTSASTDNAGRLALGFALFDERGRAVRSGAMTPAPGADAARVPFAGMLDDLTEGRYRLRVAVVDERGRVGSVEAPLDLRVTTLGDVVAGDLVLARFEGARTDAVPAASTFDAGEAVAMEIDLSGRGVQAGGLRTEFVVADAGNPAPLWTFDGSIGAAANGVATTSAVVRAGLLPPGRYEARVVIARGAARLGVVSRPFVVRPAPVGGGTEHPAIRSALVDQIASLVPSFSREAAVAPEAVARALARFGATPGRAPDPAAATFLEGVERFRRGELEAAAGRFREALRLRSDFAPAIVYLGACYAVGGRDREAVGAWQTALAMGHDDIELYQWLTPALLRLRESAEAGELIAEALGRWPADATLRRQRLIATLLDGRTAEALATIDTLQTPDAELLFVALSLLNQAAIAGRPIVSAEDDVRRLRAYAAAYRAAGGPHHLLVDRWVASLK